MKIKLTILFIAIFIIVLACSASALGYLPDNISSSDIKFCQTYPSYEFPFFTLLDVVYADSSNIYQITVFTFDYTQLSESLLTPAFLNSSLDAVSFLNLDPLTTSSTMISSLYFSDTYTNLDSILTGINSFGDNYRNYINSSNEISRLESLVYEYENVRLPFERSEGYSEGYHNGNKVGYNKGYTQGYNEGETAGIETADVAKTSILTVLSAPFYALSSVFNFEIFGINILTIITTLITLAVIAFVLKKIKG